MNKPLYTGCFYRQPNNEASGISDHEAEIVDIKTKVKLLTKKKPRKTFLKSKGNIPGLKTRLKDEFPEYIKRTNNKSIEICWGNVFRPFSHHSWTSIYHRKRAPVDRTSPGSREIFREQYVGNNDYITELKRPKKKDRDWAKFKNIRRNIKYQLEVEHKIYLSNLLEIKDETNTESPISRE
ncbi:Hypothetical predicted protein [Mytilus galloprovincialis]|uniref:Uncharacterized protein n=1 Tax=Mytilus galloprovincialis TaxID=29158 RepID=A0A8B6F3K6_MYTGA|nr:Hypothetical predicted protein [Mytilus galloprovincialis]